MFNACRLAAMSALVLLAPSSAHGEAPVDPLKFFEGRTLTEGTTKIMLSKPYRSRTLGVGTIRSDGSLALVQQVEDEGKPAHERRWLIREVAPGRFSGTMSQASGPVAIDQVAGRYRLRLKATGGYNVEQWLTPLPGGKSARSRLVVRKFGIVVATGEGFVTKLP
jgi:hypothetical protein